MAFSTLALIASLFSIQEPAMPGRAMVERVSSQAEASSEADCDAALASAETRNAEALFVGSNVCGRFARTEDAIFLTLVAQARALADMSLVVPSDLPEPNADGVVDMSNTPPPPMGVIDLWSFIYAYGGGAGPTEFYRDVANTDRLFARLRSWTPLRPDGYNPGWENSREQSASDYAASISANIEHRIDQLTPLAVLYRDDVYYALQRDFEALLIENGNTFEEGTPAYDRYQEIEQAKARRQQELGVVI